MPPEPQNTKQDTHGYTRHPNEACEDKIMDCRPLPPLQLRTIASWRQNSMPCCCDLAATSKVPKQEWNATESSANGSFASSIQNLCWPQQSRHGIVAEGKHTCSLTFQNMPYITSKTTTNIRQHLFRLPAVLLVEASWANCLDWSTLASSV